MNTKEMAEPSIRESQYFTNQSNRWIRGGFTNASENFVAEIEHCQRNDDDDSLDPIERCPSNISFKIYFRVKRV